MGLGLIVLLVIVAIVVFTLIALYNGLVQLRVRADSAWSDIDVQLKRRHDLIPNLVETVKGYAAHERGTFENIANGVPRRRPRRLLPIAPRPRTSSPARYGSCSPWPRTIRSCRPRSSSRRCRTRSRKSKTPCRMRVAITRGGPRLQHAYTVVPGEHDCRLFRLPDAPVLRAVVARREGKRAGKVLGRQSSVANSQVRTEDCHPTTSYWLPNQARRSHEENLCRHLFYSAHHWLPPGRVTGTLRLSFHRLGQRSGRCRRDGAHRRGLRRQLPGNLSHHCRHYAGPNGTNYRLFLKVESVTRRRRQRTETPVAPPRRLSQAEDLHPRRRGHAEDRHHYLFCPECNALLRRSRRVLLERDPQRLAGADHQATAYVKSRPAPPGVCEPGFHRRLRLA